MNTNTQRTDPENIIPSGLHPEPSADTRVMNLIADICQVLTESARQSLRHIREAEQSAISRLNEYVPTEPLLDRKLAAAYLRIRPRTVDYLTSPSVMELPFVWVGGVKRFRKKTLDAWLEEREVKRQRMRL